MKMFAYVRRLLHMADIYGHDFSIKVKETNDKKNTILGTILSIVTIIFVVMFAIIKYNIMRDYGDTTIMDKLTKHSYTWRDQIPKELGFHIAYGLVRYDDSTTNLEDPDYATI